MYWQAARVKYDGRDQTRVGILLFDTLTSEKPVLCVLGCLECDGIKNKWERPMKIKRWLLYNPHSCSYATHFLKKTIFNETLSTVILGEREMLYGFDQDIIMKKFPSMSESVFKEIGKKKKRK